MYSKAFKRSYNVDDKTGTSEICKARDPVVLTRLSDLHDELQAGRNGSPDKPSKSAEFEDFQLSVYDRFDDIQDLWCRFENDAACFIYQRFAFCRTWYETAGKKDALTLHMVVVSDQTGETLMLVPLCIVKGRFGTVVHFIGEGMADYLAPLVQDDFANHISNPEFEMLWQKILATINCKVDLVWLDRQPVNIVGARNPVAQLAHFDFTSSSHALNFPQAADWHQCARLVRSNKTANNIDRRLRKLSKLGEVKLIEITGTAPRRKHMSDLLALKIKNLNDAGTLHRMDTTDAREFHQALVSDAGLQTHVHQFELRCGDRLVASVLGFTHHDMFYYQVCAFNRKEFGQFSPGLLLLYQLFDWSFSRGIKRFDMTIGDEVYKKDWSNDTTSLKTVAIAISNVGRVIYLRKRLILSLKAYVKNTPILLKLAKRVFN